MVPISLSPLVALLPRAIAKWVPKKEAVDWEQRKSGWLEEKTFR
jgi:hypothetical protein